MLNTIGSPAMLINGIYHTSWQLGVSRTMKMKIEKKKTNPKMKKELSING